LVVIGAGIGPEEEDGGHIGRHIVPHLAARASSTMHGQALGVPLEKTLFILVM